MNILNYIDFFPEKKILIVGDIMIDSYLWGDVKRISPEAPVPILSRTRREHRLGGAANVAKNIHFLGAEPILVGVVGNDANAELFEELLSQKNNIGSRYLVKDSTRPTSIKTRIISNGQQLLRIDDEVIHPLSAIAEAAFIEKIVLAFSEQKIDAVIFEDYDKGVITEKVIETVTRMANDSNIPVFVDPKRRNFFEYSNVTLFKPNFAEFTNGLNIDVEKNDFDTLLELAQQHKNKYNIKNLLITLSEHGMLLCGDECMIIPAQKRQIADVSGAGDTVISVLTLCYASGMKMENAARVANIAGGIVCEKPGVVPIDLKELINECQRILHQ
jgi:D-glycero-beta-D-manno-heptose-7-phosphate kinase